MAYHAFVSEDGTRAGSFETFYADDLECHGCGDCESSNPAHRSEEPGHVLPAGWYWWACFPGCMPDGDPSGPFETEEEAIEDANSR